MLKQGSHDSSLIRCSARLLSASEEIGYNIFGDEALAILIDFCLSFFKQGAREQDPLHIQSSMECFAMVC